jgi:hypothetical protein
MRFPDTRFYPIRGRSKKSSSRTWRTSNPLHNHAESRFPDGMPPPSLEEAAAAETAEQVFELRSSAMLPIDDPAAFAEQDKLAFISQALQTEYQFDGDHDDGAGVNMT